MLAFLEPCSPSAPFLFPLFFEPRIYRIVLRSLPSFLKNAGRFGLVAFAGTALQQHIIIGLVILLTSFVIRISPRTCKSHLQILSCHIRAYKIALLQVIFKKRKYGCAAFVSDFRGFKTPVGPDLTFIRFTDQYALFPFFNLV